MKRSNGVRLFLGCLLLGSLITIGCKKDEEPASVPVPSASAPALITPPPAASDDADGGAAAAPSDAPSANPTPQPVVTTTVPAKQESIDACCTALKAVAKSGKTATAKSKAASAAAVCPGIAKLVKSGTTTRSAGLSQIRSALTGFAVPGECR